MRMMHRLLVPVLALAGLAAAAQAQDAKASDKPAAPAPAVPPKPRPQAVDPKRLQKLMPGPRPRPQAAPLHVKVDQGFKLEDVVSFKLKPGASINDVRTRADEAKLGLIFPPRPNRLGVADVTCTKHNALEVAAFLKSDPAVALSETNWVGAYESVPNDRLFAYQWNLVNSGDWGATADADVDADEAWDITTGSPSVVIAVLDNGVQWDHPDLQDRFAVNEAEAAGSAGTDDDGNGFTDDFLGWNFDTASNDITSSDMHGTAVAGIIGALANNEEGIAGIAGGTDATNGCRLLVVGIGDAGPRSSLVDDAILYAIDRGAKVINISFQVPRSDIIKDALTAASSAGVTVVCAAGNYFSSVAFPASNANVIPVASTGSSDEVSSFSSPGDPLRDRGLAAPGENILTLDLGSSYSYVSGTSYAAPQVAAAVGLILSMPSGATLTPAQIRDLLRASADPLSAGASKVGAGRLNIAAALRALGP
jgi:serine protease